MDRLRRADASKWRIRADGQKVYYRARISNTLGAWWSPAAAVFTAK